MSMAGKTPRRFAPFKGSSAISRCSLPCPVFYALGLPLLENAWDSLKRGIANTDVLLVAGVSASFLVSVNSMFRDHGPVYFEVGCMVLVLVTLGRWLEATGKAPRVSVRWKCSKNSCPKERASFTRNAETEKSPARRHDWRLPACARRRADSVRRRAHRSVGSR